jgi:hypothetical protein
MIMRRKTSFYAVSTYCGQKKLKYLVGSFDRDHGGSALLAAQLVTGSRPLPWDRS